MTCAGSQRAEAYNSACGGKRPRQTASEQASRWLRRPEIAARVQWLRVDAQKARIRAPEPAAAQVERKSDAPRKPREPADDSQPITREEVIKRLSTMIRLGDCDASTVSSLVKLMPELTAQQSTTPDPCAIVAYLAQCGGRPGAEIARELGGLPFLLRRFMDALRITGPEVAQALGMVPAPS